MLRRWILSHKSLVATATSGFLVAALVAAVAIVSTGYTAQRIDLGDASVWVANDAENVIGRANTDVFELNTVVESEGDDIDIVQRGATVLQVDRGNATVGIVDAATSVVLDSVALPPASPDLYLAGDNVVVHARGTGGVWIVPLADLAGFDADTEPTLSLGAESVVSVDENGLLFAFSPDAKKVYRVEAATSGTVSSTAGTTLGGTTTATDDRYSITSVAGRWAVLDSDDARLELSGRVIDLAEEAGAEIDELAAPVLQRAAAEGDEILVGHSSGLVSVALSSGAVDALFGTAGGSAAAPVSTGGCAFAAWSDGQAWRQCSVGDSDPTVFALESVPAASTLSFRVNQERLVLNDARAGASWAVQSDGELIDNWDELITADEDLEQVEENDETTPPEVEKNQLPPVAVDDEFGARPGRASSLPVLINDYDPNADVLVVRETTGIDPAVGRLDVIDNRQKIQLTLEPTATGTVSFGYTIDDGRGGSASATVVVTVRAPGENSPPQQVRTTRLAVASDAQATVNVLGDWVDPDGDPFFLERASVSAPTRVAFKPEGAVTVSNDSSSSGGTTVALVVSDGYAQGSGGLSVSFAAAGAVPLVADPFVAFAYAGQEKLVLPLEHVRGGNGVVRLNAVPPKAGVTITPSYETGGFRFESDQVRSHYLEYVVTDGDQTVTGLVRVDVSAPPDANTQPVTIPKTVFVPTLSSRTVDVASTDYDPAGGVLLVTGVFNVPGGSGVRAEVLEQRSVRVTLTGPLAGPVTFDYRVTNGLSSAEGTVTVIEVEPPIRQQPPIARDDTATVRVGDAITIDVMDNDEQPDGEPITLNPVLVDGLDGDSGLLFASGSSLRYLAPKTAGNYTAVYEIVGPLGQTAQAQLSIEVREPNAETNSAPVPTTVVARVLAGERVRIDIPLSGIDPDGDSVQLLGQETSPEKGGVVEVGASYLDYEAGVYSAGTDTFTYTVMDALGARASGTVRVGISPPLEGARNPVAVEDAVDVRPGATVQVQVLENDSDPDGSALTVVSAVPNDDNLEVRVDDGAILTITAPSEPGLYGLVYSIENGLGGSSSNFVTVTVRTDAPLAYPVARDAVLTLSDVLDRTTIDVNVLANVFFADGSSRALDLSIVPGYGDSAEVTSNKQVRVTIGDASQIIPFAVAHPDDPGIRSYAFIWVPGFSDALPQLNRNAPRLRVDSGDTLTVELNDYVLAVGGKRVRLTDSSTVRATHSDGSSLVVDGNTLRYRSADLYFGQASVSFEVTDGASASDPAGRKANLVLPITVDPRDNQPPVFTGATIDFEPSQEKVIDLTDLTNYPYADDVDELAYSVEGQAPAGFTFSVSGQRLTLRANADAVKGSVTAITLGVRDALAAGSSGRIQLSVVASTRPLPVPATDTAVVKRGQSTTVDVLANDEAANPFPGRPLRVVAVRGLDGASLPAGVSVTASTDNRTLTATVSAAAAPVDANLQYQVSDATGDPDRYVWGSVRISVQDVPDAPARPVRQGGGETSAIALRITAPQANNSAITRYTVVSSNQGGYSHDCGTTLVCQLPGLVVGAEYRFQVIATNAIGDSAASAASDPYTVDYLPSRPSVSAVPTPASGAPNGGSITVSWPSVPDPSPGTAVTGYVVEVAGSAPVRVGRTATSATIGGLANGSTYSVAVYARNSAQVVSETDWRRSDAVSVTTVGPPTAGTATATSARDGSITVDWSGFGGNGGALRYDVGRYEAGQAVPASCTPRSATLSSPWVDSGATAGETYTYVVFASNGLYCTAVSTGPAESKVPPGTASGDVAVEDRGTGQFDLRASNLAASGEVQRFQYQLNGGAWADVPENRWLTSAENGAFYGVQTSVQFRACADAGLGFCSDDASGATVRTPVSARAAVLSCVPGSAPVPSAPPNLGPVDVSYSYSYNQPLLGIPIWSGFSSEPVPSDAVGVRVRATVTVGSDSYTDPGYGEATC
jgi:hypothetical protein